MPTHHQPRQVSLASYDGRQMYLGDLHNHCGISYGHGSIEDAFTNARLQLDFGTVTGHAWWHDIPEGVPEAAAAVAYHQAGFKRLADQWDHVQQVTADAHTDGEFVSFLSFEWHSSAHGDHCIYYNGPHGEIIRGATLADLHGELRRLRASGVATMAIPHHLGYLTGRRGANWDTFTAEFSPVAEIMSMHGCGESDDAPRPYLHTMGPRHTANTALAGLLRGHRFGVIGSTDHHSAHPGSFGHGRAAVWAPDLSRDSLWQAIQQRRTYAVTGDPIILGVEVNGTPMGGETPRAAGYDIAVQVQGEAPIDYVEVLRNGELVARTDPTRPTTTSGPFSGVVPFNVGWGHLDRGDHPWDVELTVTGGELVDVTPRLRGEDIVMPSDDAPAEYQFTDWGRVGEHGIRLRTSTHGNANVVTDGTQGLNLHLTGDDATVVDAVVNGQHSRHRLGDLRHGSQENYLAEFLTPVYRFGRAVAAEELAAGLELAGIAAEPGDFFHVRVRQTNDQWAWSSPVWVGA
ncbi:hypothetical protein ACQBAU_09880 [Propionibacteriaceae bacterium Y2011]